MDSTTIAKWLIGAGALLLAAGILVWLAGRAGLPLGRLPGDIRIEGEGTRVYIPIVTCIVLSIILTVVLNLVARFFR